MKGFKDTKKVPIEALKLKQEEGGTIMNMVSEKELAALNELLCEEELLIKKFKMLASHTNDAEIKSKFEEISNKHQSHFNSLYEQLR